MSHRAFLLLTSAVVLVATSCRGGYWTVSGHYRTVELDPVSLELRVSGGLGSKSPGYRTFVRFTDTSGRHTVSDCEPYRRDEAQVCYNQFLLDANHRLIYRTKHLRLLSGPYGTVYGIVRHYYAERYGKNSLQTRSWLKDLRQVPPVVSRQVEGIEKMPLSAVSVVRIFRAEPEFLIASSNYSSDGHLYALHVYGAKDGEWVHSSELPRRYRREFILDTRIGDDKKTREYFGILGSFPVAAYLAENSEPFAEAELHSVLDVVNLHYDESRVVRQAAYVPGKEGTISFLTFPQTKEDEALRVRDRRRGFADIAHTRK